MHFFNPEPDLASLGHQILQQTYQTFPSLQADQIALTWLVYEPDAPICTNGSLASPDFWRYQPRGFSHRGSERIYPASIVKLFYLVALQEWLEKGMAKSSTEIERAMADMVIDSSNDATSGPELPAAPFETWKQQRNIINRYFQSLQWSELAEVNINQKPWGDGPYGRERAFVGELYDNRNMLTTSATARLLHSLLGGIAVSASRSQLALDLMVRDIGLGAIVPPGEAENQVNGFLGEGLPAGTELWSKAGWTSQVRHDAAYFQIPKAPRSLLVVFTTGHAENRKILPFVAEQCASALQSM
jgi:beta-lactamase class A